MGSEWANGDSRVLAWTTQDLSAPDDGPSRYLDKLRRCQLSFSLSRSHAAYARTSIMGTVATF